MNDKRKSLTSLLNRSVQKAERSTLSLKYFPARITSSTYQLRMSPDSVTVHGDPSGLTVDVEVSERMAKSKAFNWLRTAARLYPLKEIDSAAFGEGMAESLLRAVSTVLWGHLGVYDDRAIACLRQVLLDNVLSNASHDSELVKRWTQHNDVVAENGDLTSATSTALADLCSGDMTSLHAVHVFALSQTICRPIIVVSDNANITDAGRLSGIYLPLLQPLSSCCRYPIIVDMDSHSGSFRPLVTAVESSCSADAGEAVFPLCSCRLEPLEVRCLLDTEKPECLLETYLRVLELPCMRADGITDVPTARLDRQPVASFDELWLTIPGSCELPHERNDLPRCSSPGCRYYGLVEYSGRCYECYRNQSTTPGSPESRRIAASEAQQKREQNETPALREQFPERGRCVNQMCNGIGSQHYGGLCATCYIDPDRFNSSPAARERDFVQSLYGPSDRSASPLDLLGEVQTVPERRVTFAPADVLIGNGQLNDETVERNAPCITEGCPAYARNGSILCSDCETLQKIELQRLQESRLGDHHHQHSQLNCEPAPRVRPCVYCTGPTPVGVAAGRGRQVEPLPGHGKAHLFGHEAKPIAGLCISDRCDRYGDPVFDGYCSVCYGHRG